MPKYYKPKKVVYSDRLKRSSGRKKSTANELSSFLLGTNKIVRDINAVQKGTLFDRITRRVAGKFSSHGIGKISDFFK